MIKMMIKIKVINNDYGGDVNDDDVKTITKNLPMMMIKIKVMVMLMFKIIFVSI